MTDALHDLELHLATIVDLRTAAAVLEWDQQTHMPPGGGEARAHALTTLSRLAHEHSTSDELGHLLDAVAQGDLETEANTRALLRVARRDYEHARKLPAALVTAFTHATAIGPEIWQVARATNDWNHFAPHLERIVDLTRQVAERLGYAEHPYDALLDQYEPGTTTAQVRTMFAELREGLVPLVKKVLAKPKPAADSPLHQPFSPEAQLAVAWQIALSWGFVADQGRQDRSVHPFCTSFGPHDVRITTRTHPNSLAPALFGTMHETGHGLYEQGIDPALARSPLGQATSLGVHESQSRLWENLVGRSLSFWRKHYPALQTAFPQLQATTLDQFYRAVNVVQPSLIRVEADELTYNLHILLRFELETGLVDGSIKVRDLPDLWRSKMEALVGSTPPTDADGVLQDIHWSSGLIGYFPTYSIGNVLSVQLWEAAQRAEPGLAAELAAGEYGTLLAWLRHNVHRHGSLLLPNELIQQATGEPLNAKPYLRYLHAKFGELYGLDG